jgi:hypothetical protein
VFVRGQVDRQREEPQLRVNEVLDVAEGQRKFSNAVVIRLREEALDDQMLAALRKVLADHPGPLPLYLELEGPNHARTLIRAGEDLRVAMDEALGRDLEDLLGDGHVVLTANGRGAMVKL